MPHTRPDAISDGVSLSDKVGREVRAFVTEEAAADALLTGGVSKSLPYERSISQRCAKDNLFAGSAEDAPASAVAILMGAVVSLVEFEAGPVSIFGEPPKWAVAKGSLIPSPL